MVYAACSGQAKRSALVLLVAAAVVLAILAMMDGWDSLGAVARILLVLLAVVLTGAFAFGAAVWIDPNVFASRWTVSNATDAQEKTETLRMVRHRQAISTMEVRIPTAIWTSISRRMLEQMHRLWSMSMAAGMCSGSSTFLVGSASVFSGRRGLRTPGPSKTHLMIARACQMAEVIEDGCGSPAVAQQVLFADHALQCRPR